MSDIIDDPPIPNRGSVEGGSRFKLLPDVARRLEIRLNGCKITSCIEFCISEGWVRTHLKDARGRPKLERGEYVAIKRFGNVEVTWKS